MPREHSDASFLRDMLAAAQAVVSFTKDRTLEQYSADLLLRSAVERQIEIIGEAARAVSSAFKAEHPDIPWAKIMRQRHVLAHHYGEIEDERMWRVATIHIPILIGQLQPLSPNQSTPPSPDQQP
ncbi:MAG: DUF86 domain-containing protein [Planctomycetes bacterium]|nr:DUF86 domain-containing protein [Planctomycetota bacterium]